MRRLLVTLLLAASPAFAQARKLSDAACRLDGGAGCGAGGGSGTVTSVAMSGGTTGFSFSGGPITTSGTFTLSGTLAVANGGTGNTTGTATVNANLTGPVTSVGNATTITDGAVTLAKMADLAQDQMIVRTTASTGVPQTATVTAAARTVLDDTSVSAMVDTLGGASASGTGGLARTTDPALVRPAISGTPAAAGALGYVSANGTTTQYSGLTGSVGSFPRVLAVGRPGDTLTNSTTSDQDFPSVYTIPASVLVANKIIRVTFSLQIVTGVSTATLQGYIKLGSTKIAATTGGGNLSDGTTRGYGYTALFVGTAAPGASVSVECNALPTGMFAAGNSTAQPVAGIATNGTLAITPGATWSATGSTEVLTLISYLIEELN